MILSLMLLACETEYMPEGILVGNPGEVTLDTAPSDGVRWRRGRLPLEALLLEDCMGGPPVTVASEGTLDLLGGGSVELPEGSWCALTVIPSGPLIWEAEADEGWSLRLELELESLSVTSKWAFITDDASFLMVVGATDALEVDALAPEEGVSEVLVDSAHPAYDDVLFALTDEATLYDVTGAAGEPTAEDIVATDDCGSCDDTGDTASCEPCGEPPTSESRSCGGCRADYSLEEAAFLPFSLLLLLGWRRRRNM